MRAVRLIFEYDGNVVRLVDQRPVDVAVTGFDLPRVDRPGYYVDARDDQERTLARVPARAAFSSSVEVFPERPKDPITRADVAAPKGAFTVVVPASDAAHHVTIVQLSAGGADIAAPRARATSDAPGGPAVVDVASFPLTITR